MFPSENSFINIHTHFKPEGDDVFVIRNAYLSPEPLISSLPYPVSVGLHPWFVRKMTLTMLQNYLADAGSLKQVFAIGEAGIDRARDIPVKDQIPYFELQLAIAEQLGKPLIIHAVRTYSDLLPYVKKSSVQFIFHAFNGNALQAKTLTDHGAILSFGKQLMTEKNARVFSEIPDGSFFLETDHVAGLSIREVYKLAADIRNTEVDAMKTQLFLKFAKIFSDR